MKKISNWISEHKICKLIRNVVVVFLIVYFISNIVDLLEDYSYYERLIKGDEEFYEEEILNDLEHTIESDLNYNKKMIIDTLNVIDYINKNPNLKNFNSEKYIELSTIVDRIKSKKENYKNLGEIKNEIIEEINNNTSELMNLKECSKDEINGMYDILELQEKNDGCYSEGLSVFIKDRNYSIDAIIKEIEDGNYEVLTEYNKFINEKEVKYTCAYPYNYVYYGLEYPHAMQEIENDANTLAEQIVKLLYSLVIGIFVGIAMYIYSYHIKNNLEKGKINKKEIIKIIVSILILLVSMIITDSIISDISIKLPHTEANVSASFYYFGFQYVYEIVIAILAIWLIASFVCNKIRINNLNKTL